MHGPRNFNMQIHQSIHGAAAWLFLAPCHFIYEVLVFDKRISFMHRYQASSCLIIRHETLPCPRSGGCHLSKGSMRSWLLGRSTANTSRSLIFRPRDSEAGVCLSVSTLCMPSKTTPLPEGLGGCRGQTQLSGDLRAGGQVAWVQPHTRL